MKEIHRTITLKIQSFLELSAIDQQLITLACKVRNNAQAPYSNFKVGASVLSETGNVFNGCNVERCSYTQTTHAEQNAIDSMIAAQGPSSIAKIAIVGARAQDNVTLEEIAHDFISSIEEIRAMPCGQCLQIIWENCGNNENIEILVRQPSGIIAVTTIGCALPIRFGPQDLGINYSLERSNKTLNSITGFE